MLPTFCLIGVIINAMALIAPGVFLWATYESQSVPGSASNRWFAVFIVTAIAFLTTITRYYCFELMEDNVQQDKKSFVQRLGFLEVLALSTALMAPTTGVALNTPFIAQSAGFNVPLIFVITTIAILAIGVAFIRLSKQFAHAGSVYGLTKEVLGTPSGLVSGWGLVNSPNCSSKTLLACKFRGGYMHLWGEY